MREGARTATATSSGLARVIISCIISCSACRELSALFTRWRATSAVQWVIVSLYRSSFEKKMADVARWSTLEKGVKERGDGKAFPRGRKGGPPNTHTERQEASGSRIRSDHGPAADPKHDATPEHTPVAHTAAPERGRFSHRTPLG